MVRRKHWPRRGPRGRWRQGMPRLSMYAPGAMGAWCAGHPADISCCHASHGSSNNGKVARVYPCGACVPWYDARIIRKGCLRPACLSVCAACRASGIYYYVLINNTPLLRLFICARCGHGCTSLRCSVAATASAAGIRMGFGALRTLSACLCGHAYLKSSSYKYSTVGVCSPCFARQSFRALALKARVSPSQAATLALALYAA